MEQEAKESVERDDGDAESDELGSAKAINTKFGSFIKVYE